MTSLHLPCGQHGIWDIYGVAAQQLTDVDAILVVMQDAAKAVGAKILHANTHHFGEGMGVTGVLLLAESHLSIHTWPEHGYAAVDIFMCGQVDLSAALQPMQAYFQPAKATWTILARGQSIHP